MGACYNCDLSIRRNNIVLGEGNKQASIMLIGEAPGYHEDKQGTPFIGESGKYLRQELADVNINTNDIYMTNVVKCRPPKNRDPSPDEIKKCVHTMLSREIKYVNPIFIVPVGRIASSVIFGATLSIRQLVNKWYKVGSRYVLPMYHPAYILKNPKLKASYSNNFRVLVNNLRFIESKYAFDIAADFNKPIDLPF